MQSLAHNAYSHAAYATACQLAENLSSQMQALTCIRHACESSPLSETELRLQSHDEFSVSQRLPLGTQLSSHTHLRYMLLPPESSYHQ